MKTSGALSSKSARRWFKDFFKLNKKVLLIKQLLSQDYKDKEVLKYVDHMSAPQDGTTGIQKWPKFKKYLLPHTLQKLFRSKRKRTVANIRTASARFHSLKLISRTRANRCVIGLRGMLFRCCDKKVHCVLYDVKKQTQSKRKFHIHNSGHHVPAKHKSVFTALTADKKKC